MKELSEYTDEELKEELRRRIVIKMRGVAKIIEHLLGIFGKVLWSIELKEKVLYQDIV